MARSIDSPRHPAIAELLTAERNRAGLRQVDLAKKLRRGQDYISYVETGRKVVDVVEFLEWAEAIGFDPAKAIRELYKIRK